MKNKYTYVWVSLVILVFGIIFIPRIIERVKSGSVVENTRMNVVQGTERPLEYITLNNKKRRVPEFSFLNQDSLLISNEDYKGKVYVVEFFFTTCPTICPIMNQNLVEIQDEFREFDNFGIASFTINPEYDTPIVLKAYAEKYGITDMDWNLLTGSQEEVMKLANEGFNIFAASDPNVPGGFEHSGLFALVDKNGYIRSRKDPYGNPLVYYRGTITESQGENFEGEQEQISILKEDIKKLLLE
ncbi:SCO family protein [Muriicola marianensis]|uniref:Photosynthetic protein synthase II n=1 Tax=Muriicola marianensis TaxID=1324801 RepID=A0ABQ1QWV6_9FLAO|nr:SCO family protein [Muriicola marianensis]GGD46250.1 photosynthetic protein synthase II [Muriicola marianensis]